MSAVLAGVERPVGGHPVDGDEGAVDDQVGVPGLAGVPQCPAQLRGAGGQQGDGLCDVPPGRGGADAKPGGQFGERFAFTQVGQHQQGLPSRVELAPGRPDLPAVAADDPGDVAEGLGRQRQRGRVEWARGAVPGLLPARFPGPLAEPAVRLSTQRALHGYCRQAGSAAQGLGILLPR
jgi:hypothetical protein